MTTLEHALLGSAGAMAAGLHRRGWQIVAWAGVAATVPDWDGLSLVFGAAAFDRLHRAAGHSLLVATALAILLALIEYRAGLIPRCGFALARRIEGIPVPQPSGGEQDASHARPRGGLLPWLVVAILATWSHLASDLLFSGHASLPDWGLKLFWPFSEKSYAFPAVRWGDPLPTIILLAGAFAMLRWKNAIQAIAALTILGLVGYIALRASWLPY